LTLRTCKRSANETLDTISNISRMKNESGSHQRKITIKTEKWVREEEHSSVSKEIEGHTSMIISCNHVEGYII
jgi:hypothetical protein